MYSFRYGGKAGARFSLTTSDEHVVVRTNSRSPVLVERPFEVAPVSAATRSLLRNFELATRFSSAGRPTARPCLLVRLTRKPVTLSAVQANPTRVRIRKPSLPRC